MNYPPDWVDGQTVGTGRRDAEGRADAIADYLGDRRGFSVLDLGAYTGYFAHRFAYTHGAKVVAVDDHPNLREGPGVVVVREQLTPPAIRKLGPFDVALCLSVLHHQPKWRAYLNALCASAELVFVETAHPDEVLPKAVAHGQSRAITKELEKRAERVIARTPGYDASCERPLWVIRASQ